ncbi:uncharacterized protein An07g03820 [Aspergillus niger]|uniref:Contig An07c0100, genomic contig n=2 Tax=Aspergillus niger TaxID=5061 RepID=A2QMZ1_ASPNC|nr:uncharacterized protein An07g03820 [Aspergillus niger]CAK48132.1 unnamed protein product [Aspergillus niger]
MSESIELFFLFLLLLGDDNSDNGVDDKDNHELTPAPVALTWRWKCPWTRSSTNEQFHGVNFLFLLLSAH